MTEFGIDKKLKEINPLSDEEIIDLITQIMDTEPEDDMGPQKVDKVNDIDKELKTEE